MSQPFSRGSKLSANMAGCQASRTWPQSEQHHYHNDHAPSLLEDSYEPIAIQSNHQSTNQHRMKRWSAVAHINPVQSSRPSSSVSQVQHRISSNPPASRNRRQNRQEDDEEHIYACPDELFSDYDHRHPSPSSTDLSSHETSPVKPINTIMASRVTHLKTMNNKKEHSINNNNNINSTNGSNNTSVNSEQLMSATLSSLDGESGGRSSSCLSPATRLRIAADCTNRNSTSDDDSGCALDEFAWVPNALKPDLVHQYFSLLPDSKVPFVNSAGEKWRVRQLLWQLPPQDTDARYCRDLSSIEQMELRRFAMQRKREALGRGTIKQLPFHPDTVKCKECSLPISVGDLAVSCARSAESSWWHPACFVCDYCHELLVDLIYFHKDNRVFCGRHHAEQLKPRCTGCDEIIFSEECTEAEGQSWHMQHFACFECDTHLGGARYVMKQEHAYCIGCYQRVYADRCAGCQQTIDVDQPHVTHADRMWHASELCFACAVCAKPLLGRPFLPRRGVIYCGVDCCTSSPGSFSPSGILPPAPPPRSEQPPTKHVVDYMPMSQKQSPVDTTISDDTDCEQILQVLKHRATSLENVYETVQHRPPPAPNSARQMSSSVVMEAQNNKQAQPPAPSQRRRTNRARRAPVMDDSDDEDDQPDSAQSPNIQSRHRHRRHKSTGDLNRQKQHSAGLVHVKMRHQQSVDSQPSPRSIMRHRGGHGHAHASGSERSYNKACRHNQSNRRQVETTFGLADHSPNTTCTSSPQQSSVCKRVLINEQFNSTEIIDNNDDRRRQSHETCSTCSSSSDSDSDDGYDSFLAEYFALTSQQLPKNATHQSHPALATKKSRKMNGVKSGKSGASPNCIVS